MNATTGSLVTRRLGAAALVALVVALAFGLYFSDPEIEQRDAVRLMYIHLPSIA